MIPAQDVFSRLLDDRVIFIGQEVTDDLANSVIAQLLLLEADDPNKDICVYINSPGGSVTAGMAMYDTMQFIAPDVVTICTGAACSMGAVLLAGGAPGKRYALPNAEIMIHQPLGGTRGQASDIAVYAKEMQKCKDKLNRVLASHTGQDLAKIAEDTDRDYFLTSEEALAYGLIDEILTKRKTDEPV